MFALLRKIKNMDLPYDIQIELFDKTIKPILLYAREIWSFGKNDVLEKISLNFSNMYSTLKKSTPSYMIYGELGIFPIVLDMKYGKISYWIKLIENDISDNVKLSTKTYLMLYNLYNVNL